MKTWTRLLFGATALTSAALSAPAFAASLDDTVNFQIAPGNLDDALMNYAKQTDLQVISASAAIRGKHTAGLEGAATPREALAMLLKDSGLSFVATGDNTVTVTADPQSGSAEGDGADGTVAALVVTAQKREENIQDVPIAISAFTEKTLQEQKIEGGFDLLKAIPNVTFSKNNFTSYNFSIRGIGTKAVSATTDPGVAVAFNNGGLIVNRLFEQEYVDIERVEVLRGPQGTLYGRNATAGVINVISAKPNLQEFSGWVKGEVGNHNAKRISAMTNIPLVNDKLAIRIAGALTQRDGYGYNAVTKNQIDGRDLWSARVTLAFKPMDRLRTNLVWERFNENDDRARTTKQLCHTDPGPASLPGVSDLQPLARAMLSQGCLPWSLYDPGSFQAPNGDSLPYVFALKGNNGSPVVDDAADPYGGLTQSTDLRQISSRFDPIYKAKADVVELNVEFDLTHALTLYSQTLYDKDHIFSTEDFNRFNTQPVFSTASNACHFQYDGFSVDHCPGGFFTDPQLGTSNAILAQDISQGESEQFSQEFRLQSNFDGPLNFSVGANYVRFNTDIDYYVFSNAFTIIAYSMLVGRPSPTPSDGSQGTYVDPNPLGSIDGYGQNYFRSRNPYKLKSTAAFGELYWKATDALKVTAGLRYTDDRKKFELWPTQLLNNNMHLLHHEGDIDQHWGEWSGRLGFDWTPNLSFTDKTMIYAFYSRGYKAGGANPPNMAPATAPGWTNGLAVPPNAIHPATFDPEFVNAYEIGSKSVLLGGSLVFNNDAFFYDYKGYQVSQIIDRLALNSNYDAKNWGLEFESLWSPTPNLRFNANLGYLHTRIDDGQSSVDVMNRTYGHDDWVVLKNWIQYPSNCIVPKSFVSQVVQFERMLGWQNLGLTSPIYTDRSLLFAFFDSPCEGLYSPTHTGGLYGNFFSMATGISYDPYSQDPAVNNGAGFATPLGGKELPNAPHWTMNVGAQYSFDFRPGWKATIRGDGYWQSQSWARVYNLNPYDKLHGWYNANLSVWVENEDGLKIEFYAKNILDKTPITDAFLNSDDSGLTTNVFVLDPRLIGLSIKKDF